MKIRTLDRHAYHVTHEGEKAAGSLLYHQPDFSRATLFCSQNYQMQQTGIGRWVTCKADMMEEEAVCMIELNGNFQISLGRDRYTFVKPVSWKPRFYLLNEQQEELAALIPFLNWPRQCHEFSLQLNEDFALETKSFLILHMLHCAICGVAMINGEITATVGLLKG